MISFLSLNPQFIFSKKLFNGSVFIQQESMPQIVKRAALNETYIMYQKLNFFTTGVFKSLRSSIEK